MFFLKYRVVFLTGPPPNFSTKKKTANQPTTAAVSENPVTKKGHDWLLSNFLFGTEIGEGQLKKTTLYRMFSQLLVSSEEHRRKGN